MKNLRALLYVSCLLLVVSCATKNGSSTTSTSSEKSVAKPAVNDSRFLGKPIVLMISLDGFRHDYVKKYSPPNLKKFISEGAAAEGIIPIYPSQTFPNHLSLITGLTAEHHGLLGNRFYDPTKDRTYEMKDVKAVSDGTWYHGSPLWVVASQQGMVSASYFWVASEAEFAGRRPDYWFPYDMNRPHPDRINQVLDWLKKPDSERPHFITLYFSTVDTAGHRFGPDSPEVEQAVMGLDRDLGTLFRGIDELHLPVDILIVSDHGMTKIDSVKKAIVLDDLVSEDEFRVIGEGPQTYLYAKDAKSIDPEYKKLKKLRKHFQVYRKNEIPDRYHLKNNSAAPDILIDVELPYVAGSKKHLSESKLQGTHGYDPRNPLMWGIFYARGPQIKAGKKVKAIKNLDVYPLVLKILDLKSPAPTDGNLKTLGSILKDTP